MRFSIGWAAFRQPVHFARVPIAFFSAFVFRLAKQATRVYLQDHVPLLITRPVWRPEEGAGVDFDHVYRNGTESGIRSAADALIDMLLLAKCDAVMIARFTSFAYQVRYTLERPGAEFFDDQQFAELACSLHSF